MLQVWGFSSTTMFLSKRYFHVLVIHEEGVNLDMGKNFLLNSGTEQPLYSLCAYIEFLRCSPLMRLLFPNIHQGQYVFSPLCAV